MDREGGVLLAGLYHEGLDFGGGTLPTHTPSALYGPLFVAKLDREGRHAWSRGHDVGVEYPVRIAADADGNAILTGPTLNGPDFGDGPLFDNGGRDVFVAALDRSGKTVWAKMFGSETFDEPYALALDRLGRPWIAGYVSGDVDFGGGVLPGTQVYDPFVLQLDRDGKYVRGARFEHGGLATAVAATPDDHVILAGMFSATVDFGNGPRTHEPAMDHRRDLFLATCPR